MRGEIVLTEIRLHLHNAPDPAFAIDDVNQVASQEIPGDFNGWTFVERAGQCQHATILAEVHGLLTPSAVLSPAVVGDLVDLRDVEDDV